MRPISAALTLAALCQAARAQPMCLASVGATLYRVNAGTVETFPNQPGEVLGLTVIPPGVAVGGCVEGDIIGVENADTARVWRVDHARSGTPTLVELGRLPAGDGVCDIAFAHGRLFGISWGAVFFEFDRSTFAQIGDPISLQPTTSGIGGLTFAPPATWYVTNGSTNRLARFGDPPTLASWTAVGSVGVDFDNSDLELYHGQVWGALLSPPAPGRLVIGTFSAQTGLFTQVWDVAAAPNDLCIALAAFNPACIGIDAQPAPASACTSGGATFSISPAGLGPFTYQWQIQNPAATGTWLTLGNDPLPLPCGGSAHASPFNAFTTQIDIAPCPGVFTYRIRCIVSNACGSATSDEATYSVCYANCDCSTTTPTLNVLDFTCFLNQFAAGNPTANCDGSTSPPVLNVNDFTCFLNQFAAGCP